MPTDAPTDAPTPVPTDAPTPVPTAEPSPVPTTEPSPGDAVTATPTKCVEGFCCLQTAQTVWAPGANICKDCENPAEPGSTCSGEYKCLNNNKCAGAVWCPGTCY
mmetsp:Transcript_30756/g.106319  ORF Transcript_30756/g.106319 Transcript_30756/m.106319 type:complete len:105 (-) Transcript_30756:63-377(-)